MARNLAQVYAANPATSALPNDLIYLARSPYSDTDDMGILFSDFQSSVLENAASAYSFVVGPTGNYPATAAGLQDAIDAAITAAGSDYATVFIQAPGINDPGETVTVPLNAKISLIGAVSEMPPTAFINQEGTFVFEGSTGRATTLIDVTLLFPVTASIRIQNLCYFPFGAARIFPIGDGDGSLTFYLKDCWIQQENGAYAIGLSGSHTGGSTSLTIYSDNSFINCNNAGGLLELNAGSGGNIFVNIIASNNSVIAGGAQSSYFDADIGFFLTLKDSVYVDSMALGGFITNNDIIYEFQDSMIGMINNQAFLAGDSAFTGVNITQNNVSYIADATCDNTPVFDNVAAMTMFPAAAVNGQGISLYNCQWGNLASQFNSTYMVADDGDFSAPGRLFAQTAQVLEVGYDSRNVGLNDGSSKLLFTAQNAVYNGFFPSAVKIIAENITGLSSQPSISIGSNAPDYNNILTNTALTLTDNNFYTLFSLAGANLAPIPAAGTEVYCKVNTPAVADVYSVRIQTNGSFG